MNMVHALVVFKMGVKGNKHKKEIHILNHGKISEENQQRE